MYVPSMSRQLPKKTDEKPLRYCNIQLLVLGRRFKDFVLSFFPIMSIYYFIYAFVLFRVLQRNRPIGDIYICIYIYGLILYI